MAQVGKLDFAGYCWNKNLHVHKFVCPEKALIAITGVYCNMRIHEMFWLYEKIDLYLQEYLIITLIKIK